MKPDTKAILARAERHGRGQRGPETGRGFDGNDARSRRPGGLLNNDKLTLDERVKQALVRIKVGHAMMRIPPDATDPDLVIVALCDRVAELEAAITQALGQLNCAIAQLGQDPVDDAIVTLREALSIPVGP